mgnify:CR=1 FL=1
MNKTYMICLSTLLLLGNILFSANNKAYKEIDDLRVHYEEENDSTTLNNLNNLNNLIEEIEKKYQNV